MIFDINSLVPFEQAIKACRKPVLLYGMGNGAEKIFLYLQHIGVDVSGVFCSDSRKKAGKSFLGFPLLSLSDAKREYGDFCAVLCFGIEGAELFELYSSLGDCLLFSPDLPVFGDEICDSGYITEHLSEFVALRDTLADELSKSVLDCLLEYRFTGEPRKLQIQNDMSGKPSGYNANSLLHIDVGAYDGDTVSEFAKSFENYSAIAAFEPDKHSFEKLKANTSHLKNIICENKAVADFCGECGISDGHGRDVHIKDGSGTLTVTIDSYCESTKLGSMKIDAEGEDMRVLTGAINTIKRDKPALCVSVYHKGRDLLKIPFFIKEVNPDYKLYLRKKACVPDWDIYIYAINKGSNEENG